MAAVAEALVHITPVIEDADNLSVLIAGVRLYEALYHAPADFLRAMPDDVMTRFGEMQALLNDGAPVKINLRRD